MQEFVYYNPEGLDFPLSDEICVSSDLNDMENEEFLVSNSSKVQAHISAREIDFYIQNSKDNFSQKIKNISKLYEIAATKYDYAQDISYEQEMGKEVLLITNSQEQYEDFLLHVEFNDFDIFTINEDELKSIKGHIGNLHVDVKTKDKESMLNVSQIVWFDAKQEGKKQSGCFDPNKLGIKQTIDILKENINSYTYKKITTYDKNICQYHERREEICSKCAEVCPTVAILKDDEKKHLVFSQIDCHGCGGCISVCPSGALDYAPTNKDAIFEMAKFYENTHPLIVPAKMDIHSLHVDLKEGVLPFMIDGEKFLDENHLLTLAQISGSQLIFYTDFLSKGTKDAIRIVNEIYQRKYKKDLILIAMNEEELKENLHVVSFVEHSQFSFNQTGLRKREIFSHRLHHIVGDEDLGVVETGEHIHYGKVNVNESNCTLCLVCVGACNVDALQADAKDNTLRINPSLCTSCGYCEVSCPEKDCLSIERDVIELNPTWFKESILAQDELFACVECGVEFATKKSIEKIANMMSPMFGNDEVKIKSLYCCADCKPKIMMQSFYDSKKGATNG